MGQLAKRRLVHGSIVLALVLTVMSPAAFAQDADTDPLDTCPVDAPEADFSDHDDIPGTHLGNVRCAAALNIVRGFADGAYRPHLSVTRAQMASFIFRTLQAAQIDLPEPVEDRFSDVAAGATHDEAIHRLAAAGIVEGGPLGLEGEFYGPQLTTRRDQMASFLVRAVGFALEGDPDHFEDDNDDTEGRFPDVPSGNVHFDNVNAAYDLGIARGSGDGSYLPQATTRRDQMASFMVRLLNVVGEARNAPTTGAVAGTVTGEDGAPIAGATVTAEGAAATTDSEGKYTIEDLEAGAYTVTAGAAGYASASRAVTVSADVTTTVDFTLALSEPPVPPTIVSVWNNSFQNGLDVRWSQWIAQHALSGPGAYTIFSSADCSGSPVAIGSALFWNIQRPDVRDVAFSGWAQVITGETYYLHVRADMERGSSGSPNEEHCVEFVATTLPQP